MTSDIENLQLDHAGGMLRLQFSDQSWHALSFARLREACRCAECSARRRAGEALPGAGVRLLRIEPVGASGLNLHFSDGHARGIYPLPYLVELVADTVSA